MYQRTIRQPVEVSGVGLHRGNPVTLRLEPLDANSGIVFYRSDLGVSFDLSPKHIVDTTLATVIGVDKEVSISTIEHFLSALYAYGIDNLRVVVDGDEMPIMDGSAISFCMLIEEAGIAHLDRAKEVMVMKEEVRVEDEGRYAILKPGKKPLFDYTIDFAHPVIRKQHYCFELSTQGYIEEIARARTFGFIKDVAYLQSIGLAKGASLQNAIGLDESRVLNPEGLRFSNEFVRHKILDAMGDIRLSGHAILGTYEAYAGSHALNAKLVEQLLQRADAFEIVAAKEVEFEPLFAQAYA